MAHNRKKLPVKEKIQNEIRSLRRNANNRKILAFTVTNDDEPTDTRKFARTGTGR